MQRFLGGSWHNDQPMGGDMARPHAMDAAQRFVADRFSDCRAAFLAGSVVRGDATATSDLDIVVVIDHPEAPFRESLFFEGWPVEIFVHTPESVLRYFNSDAERRMPTLPVMVVESAVLVSQDGTAETLRDRAQALLDAGPAPLTEQALTNQRYFVTDLLDDFEGSTDHAESFFIAAELAIRTIDLWLGLNGQWTGRGKWVMRALRRYDPVQADRLAVALQALDITGDKQPLIDFVEGVLAPAGGRLFAGFKQGGRKPDTSEG